MTATAIVSALRSGVVPERGLELFATGLEQLEGAVLEELDSLKDERLGFAKWLRGDYGAGKTFAARYLCGRARSRGFATAEVQISINDTPLHHLETVYRRMVERLQTKAHGANAFVPMLDDWLGSLGDEVMDKHRLTEADPRFNELMEQSVRDEFNVLSAQNPAFAQVLAAYYRAKTKGDFDTANGLIGWLSGQPHTASNVLKRAGIRGKVDGQAALTFLSGLLQVLKKSGHQGLVVVLDEVETIQRMTAQNREKALNALRQLVDALAAGQLPGLYLLVTGTREFFEGYKGLKALPPLAQRVQVTFTDDATFDNLRAPQVRLQPFDEPRLVTVGKRVRDLYPAKNADRVRTLATDDFVLALVRSVTAGFGGHVAITPRVFLRQLVDVLDRIDQHENYDPSVELNLDPSTLTDQELSVLSERSRGHDNPGESGKPVRFTPLED